MKTIIILIFLFFCSTSYSQNTLFKQQHEFSTGRRLYYFPEWKFSEPLTTTATNGVLGYLNSFTYIFNFPTDNFIKFSFNHYSGGHYYQNQTSIFEPPFGQRSTMFFKTYEIFFGKNLLISNNAKHSLSAGIGLGYRRGYGITILSTHPFNSYEPIIEGFSLNSLGVPYSVGYTWFPINYLGLSLDFGGSLFLPNKTEYNFRDFEVSAPVWLGYLDLHLVFRL